MLLLLLLLIMFIFYIRKPLLHWKYIKISENKFKNQNSYFSTVFSFDFTHMGDLLRMLLPFFQKDKREGDNTELLKLGKKIRTSLLFFWISFALIIIISIIISIIDLSAPQAFEDKFYTAHEFTDKSGKDKLANARPHYKLNFDDGVLTNYFDNGALAQQTKILNGSINGLNETWYITGVRRSIEHINIGYREGLSTYFYENGNIMFKGEFSNDLQHGKSIFYYPNMKIFEESNWNRGKPQGDFIVYYETGNKKIEGKYKNGEIVGQFKYYEPNGNLKTE